MRRASIAAAFVALLAVPLPAQSPRLLAWGTVRWTDGAPASSLKIQLMRRDWKRTITTFTNQAGRYALYGPPNGASYDSIVVWYRNRPLAKRRMPPLPMRERMTDIMVRR